MQEGHMASGAARQAATADCSALVTSHKAVPQKVDTTQQSASVAQARVVTNASQFRAPPVAGLPPVLCAPPVTLAVVPAVAAEPPLLVPPFPPITPASCVTSPTCGVPAHAIALPILKNESVKQCFLTCRVLISIPRVDCDTYLITQPALHLPFRGRERTPAVPSTCRSPMIPSVTTEGLLIEPMPLERLALLP